MTNELLLSIFALAFSLLSLALNLCVARRRRQMNARLAAFNQAHDGFLQQSLAASQKARDAFDAIDARNTTAQGLGQG